MHDSVLTSYQISAILSHPRLKRGVKIAASARLWRGIGSEGGTGTALYGAGLYFTADKSHAKEFAGQDGRVIELGRSSLPENPLRFDTTNDFQIWLQDAIFKTMGIDKAQFYSRFHDFSEFIYALGSDIDGIQMFTGRDSVFVVYDGEVRA